MPDSAPPPRIARLASTRRGSRTATPPSVPDVSRRLAALERQVEEALTSSARSVSRLPPLEDLLDGVLETADRLRRAAAGETEATAALLEAPLDLLYRWWWRVDVVGLERLPRRGPVLVMANRGGTLLPYEAFMLARALGSAAPESRPARPLLDDWLLRVPLVGGAATALGAVAASPAALRRVLAAGEVAITFPEGDDAVAKPVAHRYRLTAFARRSLLRVAIDARVPIVPVAVIGVEETQPVLWRVERLGRLLGLPAVPITPALVPLPTKWTIHVGEPLDAAAHGGDRRALRTLRERVRERLQGLVSDGVRRRAGLFA
jgi:1-acyl-sn-glycerol-3-phosphate acyltransferase